MKTEHRGKCPVGCPSSYGEHRKPDESQFSFHLPHIVVLVNDIVSFECHINGAILSIEVPF